MTGWVDLNFWRSKVWEDIKASMDGERQSGKFCYPPKKLIFRSLALTPLHLTKVVILGQDPYHTPGASDGLAFSCPKGHKLPPSLSNIFKELNYDLRLNTRFQGPLDGWAKQGVLLINSVWTVRAHEPQSHTLWGWQNLTKEILELVASINQYAVFVLWGKHAQSYKEVIGQNGWIIEAAHPSPLSANHKGFFGSRPFSQINEYLTTSGEMPIDWAQVNDYKDDLYGN